MPQILAASFPPLARYCPVLETISPQQALWLLLDCREAFYGGAAGGGKSAALLMAGLQYVDVPGYRALILRRTFAQLSKGDALIPLSQEWLARSDARWSEQRKTWTFPSGATLEFGHVQNETDKLDYQGAAYQFVGFDELTQFTESIYTYIAFSRQRRRVGREIAGVPVRVRSTANPGGEGHAWVKRRFIEEPAEGVVFIPAKVRDNPGLDADDYEQSLMHLPDVLRAQLMEGDWGAFEGAAYPMFDEVLHVVDVLDVPDTFERFESMDHGTTHPTAWLAWAVDYDGNLIACDELYRPALPSEFAPEVHAARERWYGEARPPVVWGDPSIFAKSGTTNRRGRPASVVDEYQDAGITIARANNDQKAGYVRLAELLKPDPERRFPAWHPRYGETGSPRMFVTRACPHLIAEIQAAPLAGETERNRGEAVSERWEGPYGHAHAAARYGVMSRPGPSDEPPQVPDDPRQAFQQMVAENRRKQYARERLQPRGITI